MTALSTETTGVARNYVQRVAPKDVSAGENALSGVPMRLMVVCVPRLPSSREMYDQLVGFHLLFVEAPQWPPTAGCIDSSSPPRCRQTVSTLPLCLSHFLLHPL